MSHWTKSTVKIKKLDVVKKAAEKLGLTVTQGHKLQFTSSWAGTVDAEMIISDQFGGQLGIVAEKDGTFTTQIDSFHNSIANKVGKNCETLMREYSVELTRMQVRAMGGMVTKESVLADGSIQLRIAVGG